MGRFNFLRNKVLIISIIVLLLISGTGIAAAYWKLAQNSQDSKSDSTISDSPGYGSEEERDFEIRKNFIGALPPGGSMAGDVMVVPKDSSINYQIWFKGKLDKNPELAYADVMLLIDRSMSMKSKVPPGELPYDCDFAPDSNYDNSKLCWSTLAAEDFVSMTGNDKGRIKVGYITYGAEKYTTDKIDSQNFKPLADMWENTQRQDTKKWLRQINFVPNPNNDPSTVGTAMGKATEIALDELQSHGRGQVNGKEVKKYIILLTDGVGNLNPLMTGCANFRKTPSDAWPTNWPATYLPCQIPDPATWNPIGPFVGRPAQFVDCCIGKELGITEGYPPKGLIEVTDFSKSPVGKAGARNILMPTIGFGTDINMNVELLTKIAEFTYHDPQQALHFINQSPADIQNAFRRIFYDIVGDQGAPISFKETLPPGVDMGDIQILRTINDPEYCQPINQKDICRKPFESGEINISKLPENGRVVITFNFTNANYAKYVPFESENFFVNLTVSTANAVNTAFDLDQNQDTACGGSLPDTFNNPVSWVEWKWYFPQPPEPAREPIKTKTPKLCVRLRPTQYTGDVYGLGINNYLFPGIDVLVPGSEGIASPGFSQAVWEMEKYDFSATSFSNFDNYQKYFDSQINGLIQKAQPANINSALQLPADSQGKIFYVAGNASLDGIIPIPMGPGIRTVIVEGNLNINQGIVKAKHESTTAVIVRGNVTIGDAKSIEAGIISPKGLIKIDNTSNYLNILGFLVGKNVQLKGLGQAVTQSINYDINLAKYPPPGLAGLSLPIYQEVAP